jgi:hypothetical protein
VHIKRAINAFVNIFSIVKTNIFNNITNYKQRNDLKRNALILKFFTLILIHGCHGAYITSPSIVGIPSIFCL